MLLAPQFTKAAPIPKRILPALLVGHHTGCSRPKPYLYIYIYISTLSRSMKSSRCCSISRLLRQKATDNRSINRSSCTSDKWDHIKNRCFFSSLVSAHMFCSIVVRGAIDHALRLWIRLTRECTDRRQESTRQRKASRHLNFRFVLEMLQHLKFV